jgi:hypothetical protein
MSSNKLKVGSVQAAAEEQAAAMRWVLKDNHVCCQILSLSAILFRHGWI